MWYNIDNIDKKGCLFNYIISGRGSGKTIAVKNRMVSRGEKGKRFVYIRRRKTEVESKAMSDFFVKMQRVGYHQDKELKYDGGCFFSNDKNIGCVVPLSTSVNERSQDFIDVTDIYFEEFVIKETDKHKYLKDEVITFLELYSTIARDSDVRVWFIGNNIQEFNPYFLYFDLLPPKDGIKVYKDHAIEIWHNRGFEESKKGSRFGKIIEGTSYSDYAIENKSYETNISFIQKTPKGSYPFFKIYYHGKFYQYWLSKNGGIYLDENISDKRIQLVVAPLPEEQTPDFVSNKGFRISYNYNKFILNLKQNRIFYASSKTEQVGREVNKLLFF